MSFVRRRSLLVASLVVSAAQSAFALQYSITNLGSFGGGGTIAQGINANGQVAGESYNPPHGPPHVFGTLGNAGIINPATDHMGTLSTSNGHGTGINDSGQVIGYSFSDDANQYAHSFRTPVGSAIAAGDNLGTLGGPDAYAYAINNSGQVVGNSRVSNSNFINHAFRTAPNAAINALTDDLGTLGGISSAAYGINASGQVVGITNAPSGPSHAFRTTPGGVIDASADLGVLFSGFSSYAKAINTAGNAVGHGYYNAQLASHAYFVPAGRAILPTDDLGVLLGGTISYATALNNSNVIVGVSGGGSITSDGHAVVWYGPGTSAVDLNTLIPADSGWVLTRATGINDAGQITGYGIYSGDPTSFSGFVLNVAVPEPGTLGLLMLAVPLLLRRRR